MPLLRRGEREMSTSFVDEYLVKLGSTVDQSGMQRFHQALREATAVSTSSASSIAGAFFKAQTEIVGGFTAIGSAAVGLIDKVAMADQSYRLFALHMYMSKDAARSLKVAMDALDQPLENLTWDKELRDRTHQLIMDQRAMTADEKPSESDATLQKIRDVRFEFTRMEVELEYLTRRVVLDFMKALGVGPDQLLTKLRGFNDWIIHDLPVISQKITRVLVPVWLDVKDVAEATAVALRAVGLAFTNIVGAMSGDDSIEGEAFNFEKFAKALQHVVHWFAVFAEAVDGVITGVAELAAEMAKLFAHIPAPILDAAIGGVVGGIAGGPAGAVAGVFGGAAIGLSRNTEHAAPDTFAAVGAKVGLPSTGGAREVKGMIDAAATSVGLDPAVAHAVAGAESGERQYDRSGNLLKGQNPDGSFTSATGIFQLTNATARTLGVNSTDTSDNVRGGVALLAAELKKYQGDVPTAVAAYHEGDAKMSRVLAGKDTLSPGAVAEVADVMRRMGKQGDVQVGSITIHVDRPNATPHEIKNAVVAGMRDMNNKRVQRNLSEFQDTGYGY